MEANSCEEKATDDIDFSFLRRARPAWENTGHDSQEKGAEGAACAGGPRTWTRKSLMIYTHSVHLTDETLASPPRHPGKLMPA